MSLHRAAFLKQTGGMLVVSLSPPRATLRASAQPVQSLGVVAVSGWLAIDSYLRVTVFCGKVELGTGTDTALAQLVADELGVPVERVHVIEGITGLTPDQGYTAGSQTIQSGSIPLRHAAATARAKLIQLAAHRLGTPADNLVARDGAIVSLDGMHRLTYGALIDGKQLMATVGGQELDMTVDMDVPLIAPNRFREVGRSVKRVDVPAKVFGTFEYVQNVRVRGMWHARVLRPDPVGASFVSVDRSSIATIPNVHVVQQGDFVAVAAPSEWAAIRAQRALRVTWSGGGLPDQASLYDSIRSSAGDVKIVQQAGDVDAALGAATKKLQASYTWPFQTHGSIGPSCGVAHRGGDGSVAVWSGTQGVYPMRDAIAELIHAPKESVKVTYVEASGCYGHNGADDSATDAVLVSKAVGRPVRVQWSRADEHGWDPKGPAMVMDVQGALGPDGRVAAWRLDTHTPTHTTRPGGESGNLLDGQLTGAPAAKNPNVGGNRNADTIYAFANARVSVHWQAKPALRASAMRGLGAPANCFANECFIDELAHAAGADPIEFRLAHLGDQRAKDVLDAVAKLAKWKGGANGRGVAFVQYETTGAYVAMVADITVDRRGGAIRVRDVYVAHDCGLIVNPDGLRNQIEGAVIQGTSRTLKEAIAYDRSRVTSVDWHTYPILRFSEVPNVHITLIDRRNERPVGAGEPATTIVAPAIANAVFAATGVRLRDVPFTPARVKNALV